MQAGLLGWVLSGRAQWRGSHAAGGVIPTMLPVPHAFARWSEQSNWGRVGALGPSLAAGVGQEMISSGFPGKRAAGPRRGLCAGQGGRNPCLQVPGWHRVVLLLCVPGSAGRGCSGRQLAADACAHGLMEGDFP